MGKKSNGTISQLRLTQFSTVLGYFMTALATIIDDFQFSDVVNSLKNKTERLAQFLRVVVEALIYERDIKIVERTLNLQKLREIKKYPLSTELFHKSWFTQHDVGVIQYTHDPDFFDFFSKVPDRIPAFNENNVTYGYSYSITTAEVEKELGGLPLYPPVAILGKLKAFIMKLSTEGSSYDGVLEYLIGYVKDSDGLSRIQVNWVPRDRTFFLFKHSTFNKENDRNSGIAIIAGL